MNISRRFFLKFIFLFFSFSNFLKGGAKGTIRGSGLSKGKKILQKINGAVNLGLDESGFSNVFMAKNSSVKNNMCKVIELMGGVEKYIGKNDIVVLKPNAQWYYQGMTNTDAMAAFIDLILSIPEFNGEIIIAENNHIQDHQSRGWVTKKRNGKFNYNELIEHYHLQGYKNITKYHWHDGGKSSNPLQFDGCCNGVVDHASQGDGYVWLKDSYYISPAGNKCIMTYPVFTSPYSGLTIDLKNGVWENGSFSKRPVKLINFSALNHHGHSSGLTASVKNLMGVVDMTCGWHGDEPKGTYNVHHVGISRKVEWLRAHWRISAYKGKAKIKFKNWCLRNFFHTGGALGYWMKNVRMPDLNIITAEKVGWGSRIDVKKSSRTKTILASLDPVAMDYVAAKEVLLPVTPKDLKEKGGSKYYDLHNPDNHNGPFYKFLREANNQGIGNLDPNKIKIHKYDFFEKSNEKKPA